MTRDQQIRADAVNAAAIIVAALIKKSESRDEYELYENAKNDLSNLTKDIALYIESDISI